MSSLQGIPGLPFHWSAGGKHEYAHSIFSKDRTNTDTKFYTFQLTCPADRIVYVISVHGITATNMYFGKAAADITLATASRVDAVVPASNNFGTFDTTALIKCGDSTPAVIIGNTHVAVRSSERIVFGVPLIGEEGDYFTFQRTAGGVTSSHVGIEWLEKKIP